MIESVCCFSAVIGYKVLRSERKRSAGIWTFPVKEARTIPSLPAFYRLLSVAKASNETIAIDEIMLSDQVRLSYGKMLTPTPSRVRVHSDPP